MLVKKNPATTGGSPPASVAPAPVAPAVHQPPAPRPASVPAVQMPRPAVVVPAAVQAALVAQAPAPTPPAQQIAAAPPRALAVVQSNLPAYIEAVSDGEMAVGFENVGSEAFQLPMLSIAQSQSPQVQDTKELQAGDAYLTTQKNVKFFGVGDVVEFIPFFYYKSWDEWQHRDLGGGRGASSVDPCGALAMEAAKQLRARMKNPRPTAAEQPTSVIESLTFLVLFADLDPATGAVIYQPVAIPFAKSKYKKGKLLLQLSQRRSQGKYPLYGAKFTLTTTFDKGKPGQGGYFNFDVDNGGDPTAEEYTKAKEAYLAFKPIFELRQLQVKLENDEVEEAEIVGPIPTAEAKGY